MGPRGSLPHGLSRVDAKRGGHSLQADFSLPIRMSLSGLLPVGHPEGGPTYKRISRDLSQRVLCWSLNKRRELLRTKAMPKLPTIHFSDSFAADAEKMISAVRAQGLEGIVAKRRDSLYEPGRNGAWVKMRIGGGQEFVIGGFTPSPKNFDAILVGYFQRNQLMFAARVRNGFVPSLRTAYSENSKASKLENAHSLICRRVRKGVGVKA
jgi:hypothetical protein